MDANEKDKAASTKANAADAGAANTVTVKKWHIAIAAVATVVCVVFAAMASHAVGERLIGTMFDDNALSSPEYRKVTINGGTGPDECPVGWAVSIYANAKPEGQRFKEWEISPDVTFLNGTSTTDIVATFIMPDSDATATAIYEPIPEPEKAVYVLTINGGTGPDECPVGWAVSIYANAELEGQRFKEWEISPDVMFSGDASATDRAATFIMPASDVTATATYEPVYYTLDVADADSTGGGKYAFGEEVTITAIQQKEEGLQFGRWSIVPDVVFTGGTGANSDTASFIMPASNVKAVPLYGQGLHRLTVTGGSGSGNYTLGQSATIAVNRLPEGQAFAEWEFSPPVEYDWIYGPDGIGWPYAVKFKMPANDVTATVIYRPIQSAITVMSETDIAGRGESLPLRAIVSGTDSPAQGVAWTVIGGSSGTTIDEHGTLHIAEDETAKVLEVRGTSTIDDTEYGVFSVIVAHPPEPYDNTSGGGADPVQPYASNMMWLWIVLAIMAAAVTFALHRKHLGQRR
ncbi:MAG: hypothetical protein FWH32_07675 [Clostridiales bacterium]|nr:hypothetical protein [Clostridiales bacterium]